MGYGRPHPGRALRRRLFMRGRTLVLLAVIALLGVAAFWIDFGFGKQPKIDFGGYTNDLTVHQGLDLQGGLQIVLEATCPTDKPKCDINASMPAGLHKTHPPNPRRSPRTNPPRRHPNGSHSAHSVVA